MSSTVARPSVPNDQQIPRLLDAQSVSVRAELDAAGVAQSWARALLEFGDLTRSQRQVCYDIQRPHRADSINRSAFGQLFELSHLAPLSAAMKGARLIKVAIVMRGGRVMLSEEVAHVAEEQANHDGNLAQHRRKERRTVSTALDLTDAMDAQALASEQLAMAAIAGR